MPLNYDLLSQKGVDATVLFVLERPVFGYLMFIILFALHGMKLHYVEFPLYFAFLFSSSRRVDNESEFADSKDRGFDNGEYASQVYFIFCSYLCFVLMFTFIMTKLLFQLLEVTGRSPNVMSVV